MQACQQVGTWSVIVDAVVEMAMSKIDVVMM